ncbi:MAG: putative Ig domain-containing protein [Acidobacteriota bacterium]
MRNRRLPVLLSATLLGLPAVAAPAPDRALSLRVRDVATGRALPAMASVRGPGSTAGKIPVPASGLSRLGIPPGDVTLLVQAAGHASLQTHFDVDAGPSLPVTIWLHALDDASTAPVPEAGTGIVTGFLYDARSGQPLEGAEVSCSLGGGAVSDASGSFLLSYPSPATADRPILGAILVTHRGHESLELRGLVLQGGGVKIVEDLAPGSGVRVKDVTPMPLRSREEQEVHQSAPHATEPAAPIAGRRARPFLQTRPVPDSVDAVDLVGIAPPSVIRVGTGCSCTSCSGVSVLSLEDYVAGGLDNEWISSWAAHSLRAGSIPYRSYGAWYVYNPINGNYDICSNACCQAYDPATYGNTQSAANLTAGIMLELGGSLMRSEYSAENNSWDDPNDGLSCVNSDQSCGDGWAGSPATGWPCLSDAPCTGWGCFGHGRGECQWGTSRWANQGQLWSWIGDHYYNDNGGGSGSRTAHMTSPIFMPAFSPNPSTVIPGQTFSIDVTADNTAALGHTEIMIGASLYSVITGYVSDPANDTKVTLAVGTNSVSRPFTVPMGTPTGVYDLIVALWYDVDGDGTITGSDLSLVLATAPGAVTVADACGLMVLSPSSLPGGTIGTPYSQTITASGGQPPYTFAVTAGSLPPGLGLAGSGVLSGAPTAAGSFPFTASAVDALGCTASQGYTIAVGTPSSADNVLVGEGLGQLQPEPRAGDARVGDRDERQLPRVRRRGLGRERRRGRYRRRRHPGDLDRAGPGHHAGSPGARVRPHGRGDREGQLLRLRDAEVRRQRGRGQARCRRVRRDPLRRGTRRGVRPARARLELRRVIALRHGEGQLLRLRDAEVRGQRCLRQRRRRRVRRAPDRPRPRSDLRAAGPRLRLRRRERVEHREDQLQRLHDAAVRGERGGRQRRWRRLLGDRHGARSRCRWSVPRALQGLQLRRRGDRRASRIRHDGRRDELRRARRRRRRLGRRRGRPPRRARARSGRQRHGLSLHVRWIGAERDALVQPVPGGEVRCQRLGAALGY